MKTFVLPAVITLFALSAFSTSALADQIKCPDAATNKYQEQDKDKWVLQYRGPLESVIVNSWTTSSGQKWSFVECVRNRGAIQIEITGKACTVRPGDEGKLRDLAQVAKNDRIQACDIPLTPNYKDQSSCVVSCD